MSESHMTDKLTLDRLGQYEFLESASCEGTLGPLRDRVDLLHLNSLHFAVVVVGDFGWSLSAHVLFISFFVLKLIY